MSRLIVFGGREFPDRALVEQELALLVHGGTYRTIVHGACPTGADRYASDWARAYVSPREGMTPLVEEPHPAEWKRHGNRAGPIRNGEMVALGAKYALGFWDGRVRGTVGRGSRDMLTRLIGAGIPLFITPPARRQQAIFVFGRQTTEDAVAAIEEGLARGIAYNAARRVP